MTDERAAEIAANLTPMERQACVCLISGAPHRRIAAELETSEQRVRNLFSQIYKKTGARNRLQLVLLLVRVHRPDLGQLLLQMGSRHEMPVVLPNPQERELEIDRNILRCAEKLDLLRAKLTRRVS
jgi:DNA-binding CsgD family transcriptional regulator